MDIKEVMKVDKEYEPLFDQNLQKGTEPVKGGTDGSKHTMVFFTGVSEKRWRRRINKYVENVIKDCQHSELEKRR